ncbi:MAG: ABC transporter ATP-binding protein [Bacillota bacterium]
MLEIKDLHVYYGGIHALDGISIKVEQGEVVAIIGANGAGKSTTLRAVSGILRPASGDVRFRGESLLPVPAHKIVERGLSHVPEGRRIFANLTVMENLEMGAYARKDKGGIQQDLEVVFHHFPRLKERLGQIGGTLSGGEQQMLAIARGLMAKPRLLVMDEPSMGLAPLLVREIFSIIESINREGVTILLVEQNAHMALGVANRAYVLETGRLVLEGEAQSLARNELVKKAYLGA